MARITRSIRRSFAGELLDVANAAAFLGCSEKTIRARVASHLLPFRRLGSRIVFRRAELERWLDTLPGVTVDEATENLALRSGDIDLVRR